MTNRIVLEDPALCQLAGELATLTVQDLTTSVKFALTEQLEIECRLKHIRGMAAEIRAHMTSEVSSDHSWLYDENGLGTTEFR